MHQFVRNLITEWRRLVLPFNGGTIVVAVSGGADSVSLLLAMHDLQHRKKLSHRTVAAHFNHQLRGAESDADEEFVRDLTGRLGIELAVGGGSIPREGNMEQNARRARYSFLQQTAENLKAFAVATGHTINDQAETVLMNLIRGSGPKGLSGMKSIRNLNDECEKRVIEAKSVNEILLVRPLLTWAKRNHTEAFSRDRGVEYRYDTMNEDTAFKRVRIRKILLPLLEDMNPRIIETLAHTALLMQDLTGGAVSKSPMPTDAELSLKHLRSLTATDRCDVIRTWLCEQRETKRQLELIHVKAVESLVLSSKSGKIVEVPGGKVVKSGGKLVYKQNKVEN